MEPKTLLEETLLKISIRFYYSHIIDVNTCVYRCKHTDHIHVARI